MLTMVGAMHLSLYTQTSVSIFSKVLTRRICLSIKSFISQWSYPLFFVTLKCDSGQTLLGDIRFLVLTGRICLPIKSFISQWSYPLFFVTLKCDSGQTLLGDIRFLVLTRRICLPIKSFFSDWPSPFMTLMCDSRVIQWGQICFQFIISVKGTL